MAFLNPRAPTIEDMSRLSVCRQVDFYDAVIVRDHERMHMKGPGEASACTRNGRGKAARRTA
jgi:hypothetical protein